MRLAAFEKCGRRDGSAAVAAFHDRHHRRRAQRRADGAGGGDGCAREPPAGSGDRLRLHPATAFSAVSSSSRTSSTTVTRRHPEAHRLAKRGEIELADLGADVWIHRLPGIFAARSFSARAAQRASSRALPSSDEIATRARRSSRPEPASPFCLASPWRRQPPDVAILSLAREAPIRAVHAARLATGHPTPSCEANAARARGARAAAR